MRGSVLAGIVLLSMCAVGGCALLAGDFELTGSGGRSTTGTTGATHTTGTTGSTSAVSSGLASSGGTSDGGASSAGASTSTQVSSGSMSAEPPPCLVSCNADQLCCFDINGSTDKCSSSCNQGYLALACNDDSACSGGKVCCVIEPIVGGLQGTTCKSSCTGAEETPACNPKAPSCANCQPLLNAYYQSGQAPAPYDLYGFCN